MSTSPRSPALRPFLFLCAVFAAMILALVGCGSKAELASDTASGVPDGAPETPTTGPDSLTSSGAGGTGTETPPEDTEFLGVTGEVVGPDGEPMVGCGIMRLITAPSPGGEVPQMNDMGYTSIDDGSFRIPLPPATYTLEAYCWDEDEAELTGTVEEVTVDGVEPPEPQRIEVS